MSEKKAHPSEYNYAGDEQITISVVEFQTFARFADIVLNQETNVEYPEKYHYVNSETSEVIKKVTDKNKHLAVKVFDWEKTKASEPQTTRTPLGMDALNVRYTVQGIHLRNIEEGVAKHTSELRQMMNPTVDPSKIESLGAAEDTEPNGLPTGTVEDIDQRDPGDENTETQVK